MKHIPAMILLLVLVAACQQQASDEPPPMAESSAADTSMSDTSVYAAAVAHPGRLEGDADSDAGRKPAEVLEFIGVQRGDSVLELFAGPGYYTELLAHVVGENGSVSAHVNTPIRNFAGDAFVARHADNRLPNVEVLVAENNELDLAADQFDVITIVLNYHDLYWASEQYGWEPIEVAPFLAELLEGLKPGGILGVVDHVAAAGSAPESGSTLHRIDPGYVKDELEAAGFVFDGDSDVLRNPDDDHSKNVFDPDIRGKTDRFVMRFKKPQ
jgi:predicted methyltransferase